MATLIPLPTLLAAVVGIEPLIWTSKGNLPVSTLTYKTEWEFEQTDDGLLKSVRFIESYFQGSECVKRSVAVFDNQGAVAQSQQGVF